MTGVRPPKFLDGNEPTETIPRASLNAGAVAGGTLFQSFPRATPRSVDLTSLAPYMGPDLKLRREILEDRRFSVIQMDLFWDIFKSL